MKNKFTFAKRLVFTKKFLLPKIFLLALMFISHNCFAQVNWTKIYETTNPNRHSNTNGEIIYTAGFGKTGGAASSYSSSFDRVKIRMECTISGTLRWAEVSFDKWSGLTVQELEIPDYANSNSIQRNVSNIEVTSNMTGVNTGTFSQGRLEIWRNNYATGSSGLLLPTGNNSIYDWDDAISVVQDGHGSFQIHNVTSGYEQTILAWNLHRYGNSPEIGFGNAPTAHTDWTTNNTNGSANFKVQIYVGSSIITSSPSSSAQNICINGTATALSTTAVGSSITYQWYSNTTASNTGGTLISGATSSSYSPPTNVAGIKYYYVVVTNSLGSATSTVSGAITVSPVSVSGTVSANQSICSGTAATNMTLSGNTGTIQWQISSDNSSFSNIGGATSTTLASGTLTATRYYRAIVTSGGCSSATSGTITITVTASPTITSTTPGSNCGTGSVSLAATASAGTINWYAASSGGSSLGTGTTFNTPSISVTTTYYAGVIDGTCSSSSRTAVVATINTQPTSTVSGTQNLALDIFVVAGGGGAGCARGGGGGGGGYKYQTNHTYTSGTSTAITVGTGGTPGAEAAPSIHAGSGSNSSFGAVYIATGGGGGGSYGGIAQNGYSGGSGGGGSTQASGTGYGGSGTAGQGYAGGNSTNSCGGGEVAGGGGGGAGAAGTSASSNGCTRPYYPGNGGNGITNSISGTSINYCGGGGGGGLAASLNLQGNNGLGGGQASYGGGGQCKLNSNVFAPETGGSGIVIIRYLGTPIATGGTITQVGGYTIHTFTSNGTFAYNSISTAQVTDVTRCGIGTVAFTGTASAGYSLDWYVASTGGTALATNSLTYTTPVLNQSTVYYVATKNTSTGCASATRTAVNAILTSTAALTTDQTICIGTTPANMVLSSYTGTTQWQSSVDNITYTAISGQTAATLSGATVGELSANKYFRAVITNGGCVGNSPVLTVSVTSPTISNSAQVGDMIWNGKNSNSWATNANWYVFNGTNYVIATSQPSVTIDVIIPVTQSCVLNQPSTLSGIVYTKDLIIETGATLTMTSGTVYVSGNYENNGTFTPGTGTILFNGTTAQTISGASTFNNMSVTKTSGDLSLNSPIKIAGTLTMTQGNLHTSSANILEIGTGTGTLGSVSWTAGTIVGPLKRWFGTAVNSTEASGIFPIGNAIVNRYAKINFTQAPGVGGYIITEYKTGAPLVNGVALYTGLPAVVNGQIIQNYEDEGYYEITPYNAAGLAYGALNTSAYTLNLRGNQLSTITDITPLRIIKSSNHTAWNDNPAGDGTHVAAVGSNSDFTISATGMLGFSWFNVGSSSDNVLPIELISFSANCINDNNVEINWSTASEFNTSHYVLEKSRDGNNWNTINEQDAAGNSTSELAYSYLDVDKTTGEIYYRLTQYDIDGVHETFDIVSSNCASDEASNSMHIYPNPSNGAFNIRFEHSEIGEDVVIDMLDTKGQIVYSQVISVVKGQNMLPINNLGLSNGVYIVRIQTENGLVSEKVVLN